MIEFKYGSSFYGRDEVCDFINARKTEKKFTVIDIGGSDDPWSKPDATLDIRESNFSGVTFIGNINDSAGWRDVMTYVAEHGKFDFSVCSHTLEDVAYPALTLEMLPLVSKAGYIASPSHYRELSRGLEYGSQYRGYFHHRWILAPDNGMLTLVPKISALEYLDIEGDRSEDKAELQIWWTDSLPFKVLNGDYLGPSQPFMIQAYKDFFRRIK